MMKAIQYLTKLYNTGVIDEENRGAQVSNLVKLGEKVQQAKRT